VTSAEPIAITNDLGGTRFLNFTRDLPDDPIGALRPWGLLVCFLSTWILLYGVIVSKLNCSHGSDFW
jgi:hypothetical protein